MTCRVLIAYFAVLATLASACSDDGTDASADPVPTDQEASDATAEDPDDESGDATASGPTGRLEIGDDSYNFRLGDMTTAMCSVTGDDATIQDMRASDGHWVAATVAGGVAEITLRGPDGNRKWVTGNTAEAEGLDVSIDTAGNVLMVEGTWVDPANAASTAEGNLVVTC